jgi:hypothetical protein
MSLFCLHFKDGDKIRERILALLNFCFWEKERLLKIHFMSSLKRNKNGISVRNFLFYGDPQEFAIFLREKHPPAKYPQTSKMERSIKQEISKVYHLPFFN